jgi:integrase
MRGSLFNRGKNRWALVIELGYVTDATTGKRRRRQRWVKFAGTKKQAGEKLTEIVRAANRGEFVEPSKQTVGEWLSEWLDKSVKPTKRVRTYNTYKSVVIGSLTPAIGSIPLQALKPIDVQQYYAEHATLSAATLGLHSAVLSAALKSALRNGHITRNVVSLADGKPRVERRADDVLANVLDVEQARRLLAAAKDAGSRAAAFYALALDSGARLGELCGLKWVDIDLDTGKLSIVRQLVSSKLTKDGDVDFGPTKTGKSRTVDLGGETITLLRAHKKAQAELKLKNRTSYADVGLVFAKEQADLFGEHATLGTPLQMKNIGAGEFARLIKAADVKRITFHGLRHTSATLLLLAGEPAKVVSERLGHSKISMTLDIYSHVLPSMGRGAADRLGALLHG